MFALVVFEVIMLQLCSGFKHASNDCKFILQIRIEDLCILSRYHFLRLKK